MAESGVILPADSSGKALRTETATTAFVTGSGGVVHQQVVSVGDPTTPANLAAVDSNGRVSAGVAGLTLTTPAAVSWNSATTLSTAYTVTNAGLAGNITFWIYNASNAALFTGTPAVVFEQSVDGTNWGPLPVLRNDTNTVITGLTVPTLAANVALSFDTALEGVAQCRVRLTAVTGSTNSMAVIASMGGGFFEPMVGIAQPARTLVAYNAIALAAVATEAMISTANRVVGNTTTGSTTGVTVTTGKTFRLQNITLGATGTAAGWVRVALRVNSGGAPTATSSAYWVGLVGITATTTGAPPVSASFGDGLDIPSGWQWGFSQIASATSMTLTVTASGYEY